MIVQKENPPMRSRSVEMFLSIVMLQMGIMFALFGGNLSNPIFVRLKEWVSVFPGSELSLGVLLVTVGSMRIAALIINGNWSPSPVARMVGCVLGSLFWTVLCLAYIDAPISGAPIGIAWTLTAVAFETFSAMKCAADSFVLDSFGLRGGHRRAISDRSS